LKNPSTKILKSFGLLMGGVFSAVTAVLVYKELESAPFFTGALALAFIAAALAVPEKLRGVHERWMKFADATGRFNAKLILGFIYLTFFSLVRCVFWIVRKDPMERKFDPAADTYWQQHQSPAAGDDQRYDKQY